MLTQTRLTLRMNKYPFNWQDNIDGIFIIRKYLYVIGGKVNERNYFRED